MQTDSILLENALLNIPNTLESNSSTDSSSAIQSESMLFIDSAVKDYQVLLDNLTEPTEVILLDSQRNGLVQITESLQQYQGEKLEAVHIVSHGNTGRLFLGNTSLDRNNLGDYQHLLSSWSDAMTEHGDILLYGCNVGTDLSGTEFVETLSQYTEADILASTDLTGNEGLGGDWDLEFAVGKVETESAFKESVSDDYQSTLFLGNVDLAFDPIFVDYIDTNFPNTGSNIGFNFVFNNDLIDAGLNIDNNFTSITPGQLNNPGVPLDNYDFDIPGFNSILFNFEPAEFKFDSTNFNFSSMTIDDKFVTFDFEPSDFNFNFNNGFRNTMDFGFDRYEFEFDSMFSFKADEMRFDRNSVRFEYRNFDFNRGNLFESHVNLLDYKFTESEIFSLANENEIRFAQQLNASDYRAMTYAFDGDFMFDSSYYIKEYDISPDMNPFTDYNENGFKLDRNPNALFDTSYYIGNNPDVATSVKTGLEDYLSNWRVGLIGDPDYDPEQNVNFNPFFSSENYFTIHDDVRVESYDPDANSPLQDLMDFGIVEGRITSEIGLSDDVISFSTFITSDSEDFEIVQDKVNSSNLGIRVFPGDNGEVLIASAFDEDGKVITASAFEEGGIDPIAVVGGVFYTVAVGTVLSIIEVNRLQNELQTEFILQTGEFVTELFENITLSPADPFDINQLITVPPFLRNIFRFPNPVEGEIVVEGFPGGDVLTYNGDNIFTTPLEPITDLDSTTTFPGRDEILAELLQGPFIFPNENQIPGQFFNTIDSSSYPYPIGSSSSQGIQEVEDFVAGLDTINTPTRKKSDFFEIEQTGSLNYRVQTGRVTPKNNLEESRIDGYRGRTILEAKFTDNFSSTPFITGTMKDQFVEKIIQRKLDVEFLKFSLLIQNPSIPFEEIEVLINDDRIAPFFESLLEKYNIPGEVKVVPTQIPF